MKNIAVRALSGAVYIGVIVAGCMLGSVAFYIFITLFMLLAVYELQRMFATRFRYNIWVRAFDMCAFLSMPILTMFSLPIYFIAAYAALRMIVAVLDKGDAFKSACGSFFIGLYIVVPFYLLYELQPEYNIVGCVLVTFIIIWLNDTGAYLVGCSLGKHRLCERLSPKKSWEGFWGGFVIATALTPFAFMLLGMVDTYIPVLMIYGAAVSIVATFGDLFESLIKRYFGVKDSGTLIPGHGGILDRIDSFIPTIPLIIILSIIL